jgi:hypothetical protein
MKANVLWNLMTLGIFILALVLQGCTVDNDDVIVIDDTPPAAPRGVYTVTGDEQVLIEWYPNQEADLKGYIVYRSLREREGYTEIAEVGSEVASYVDDDVENGITYYYAVSAFDFDDNESNLSPEIADDTPRPSGRNVKLEDYILEPDRSGFDFSHPERGAQAYDRSGVDIYFGVDTQVMVPYIFSDNETDMQDLGYTDSMDDVDVSPTRGFTTLFVEAIIGHTYAFLTPDGNYAKIRVTDMYIDWVNGDVGEAWAIFDWAYQLQLDNPELAPGRNY